MFKCGKCTKEVEEGLFCPFCGTPAPAPAEPAPKAEDPRNGQVVAGKYRIEALIDRGGMGQVYKATHLALDRPVALKLLDRALLADETLVQRFHREARAASRLNHPNSVGIIDFGEAEDGTLFMVMELVPGRSLATVIRDEFPMSTTRVVKIGSQILAALTEAHALGILHCDLKPQNVMLESRRDEEDVVKVVDFGIAKLLDASDAPRLTRAGMVCGTPGYMSPEQAQGEVLDPRSDLYSVGVLLYELVTGKLPFSAQSPMGLVGKMLSERPTPPSQRRPDIPISSALEALILRVLSHDRDPRPATAEEFRRLLHACAPSGAREALRAPGADLPTAPGLPRSATGAQRPTGASGSGNRPTAPAGSRSTAPAGSRTTPTAGSRPATAAGSHPTPTAGHRAPPAEARPPTGLVDAAQGPRGNRDLVDALPLMLGSVVGAVAIGGLLVWGLTGRVPRIPPGQHLKATVPPVATAMVPASPAVGPAPPPSGAAAAARPAAPEPAAGAPPVAAAPPPAASKPAPRPPAVPVLRPLASGPPDSLATPEESSGEGVLTVLAEKGTSIWVNATRQGSAPREFRFREGTYKVRASHPGHGTAETSLKVTAGERNRWEVVFEE